MADLDKVLKRLPEDVVEYNIYPVIPEGLEDEELTHYLNKQFDTFLAHISDKIVSYIWQHEPFNLKPVLGKLQDAIPPHLHGSTSFGDNIDDEWFIVFLLYEITREFAGVVVSVNDNDEEFLLIEAADALPKWLDPESAEKRVYIFNGDLHVLPIPQAPEEFSKFPMFTPTIREALTCVRDCTSDTRCAQPVQNLINKRLSCFPRKCKENIHHVNCFLPTPLAVLLADQPALISAGVRSFYYRDPLELKACRPMKRFKPDDIVKTRVKMTRCLYAQLVQQKFSPDRRSGWTVVSPSNQERDIGIKLAHGFEILCSKCCMEDITINGEMTTSDDARWQQFKKSLSSKGYFRGEIEGSRLYKELAKEARQFYQCQISTEESETESMGQTVLKHLHRLERTFEDFRQKQQKLPPSDDDSWLNVTAEQVDEMMKSAGGLSASDASEMFDLSKVSESMAAFVEHESGVEGAEFPKESGETDEGDSHFQSSGLIHAMQKMFDFPEERDSSGSDMSEYDWSEDSDEDLGSPTKIPSTKCYPVKPSTVKPKAPNDSSVQHHQPKSVRFSSPDSSELCGSDSLATLPKVPPRPTVPPKAAPPPRPQNLHARPSEPPPPRPTNSPPPVPAHPPRRQIKPRPLTKPNTVIKPNAPPPPPPASGEGKRDKKLEALMDAMDRELAGTEVGKSFERVPKQSKAKGMGQQQNNSTTQGGKKSRSAARNIDDEDDDFRPVDVDLNVVKNTLESYKAQQGLPGPASNILAGFGINLPHDSLSGNA